MSNFLEVVPNIFRLKIPFYSVYTSVFLVKSKKELILVDCATTSSDVENYIIPAFSALGYNIKDISCLVVTHDHSDHAGGLDTIITHNPDIKVVRSCEVIDDEISVYPLPGHTKDFIGVFDKRSGTLISGDGLQGAGIKQYRTMLADKRGYIETLERIRDDERIEKILFSHAYEPWYKDFMSGRKEILDCIEECKKYIGEI